MKTTVGVIRKLIKEDLFNYTGKDAPRKVNKDTGNASLGAVGKSVSMLRATVDRLENAVRDNDEQAVHQYLQRIKQFTKAAEASLYNQN